MIENLDLFAETEASPAAEPEAEGARTPSASGLVAGVIDARERVALARRLYDDCQTSKPDWDQLQGVTQGVWLERADRVLAGDPEPWRMHPRVRM